MDHKGGDGGNKADLQDKPNQRVFLVREWYRNLVDDDPEYLAKLVEKLEEIGEQYVSNDLVQRSEGRNRSPLNKNLPSSPSSKSKPVVVEASMRKANLFDLRLLWTTTMLFLDK